MKKYWIGFAVIALTLALVLYFFYFKKKKSEASPSSNGSSQSSGNANTVAVKNDGIVIDQIVPEAKIGSGSFNYGGRSVNFNITNSVNLNNIALQNGYSYTINNDATIGEESTNIQLFLNGSMISWIFIDWVIGEYTEMPIGNTSSSGGGSFKDDEVEQQESAGGGKGDLY